MRRELYAKAFITGALVATVLSCSESSVGPGANEVAAVSIFTLKTAIGVGETHQLQARAVNYSGVRIESQTTFTWTTSNSAIVTVSNTGLVTGVAVGSAVVTLAAQGFTDAKTISVTGPGGGGS